jgi:hypothetical protein
VVHAAPAPPPRAGRDEAAFLHHLRFCLTKPCPDPNLGPAEGRWCFVCLNIHELESDTEQAPYHITTGADSETPGWMHLRR